MLFTQIHFLTAVFMEPWARPWKKLGDLHFLYIQSHSVIRLSDPSRYKLLTSLFWNLRIRKKKKNKTTQKKKSSSESVSMKGTTWYKYHISINFVT